MKAGVGDGAPPGGHSTLGRGARQAEEVSVSPASALVWPDSWEMFPWGRGAHVLCRTESSDVAVRCTLNALDGRWHISQYG